VLIAAEITATSSGVRAPDSGCAWAGAAGAGLAAGAADFAFLDSAIVEQILAEMLKMIAKNDKQARTTIMPTAWYSTSGTDIDAININV
jgi:hypothetical protein